MGSARARITGDSPIVSQTQCSESVLQRMYINYRNILSEISWSSTKGMVFRTMIFVGAPAKRKKKVMKKPLNQWILHCEEIYHN